MSDLPAWSQSAIARALIAEIIAERPVYGLSRGAWIEGGGQRVYRGKLAGQLRRIQREWLEREYAIRDAQFAATGQWDGEGLDIESADELIARILEAPAQARAA